MPATDKVPAQFDLTKVKVIPDTDAAPAQFDLSKVQVISDDFTANPKREGTYKMVAPSDGGAIKLIDIPYSQVGNAYLAGYRLGKSGDSQRYANDKFTEMNKEGETVNPNIDYAGVVPTPARGSKEWFKQKKDSAIHGTLNLLPTAGGVVGGVIGGAVGVEGGPAAIGTAALGAAAGGGLGEDIRQELEEKIYPSEPKLTAKKTALRLYDQSLLQGYNEIGGRAANWLLNPAAKYFGNTARLSKETGIPLLPSEVIGEEPSFGEKLAKGHIFSGGVMKRFRTLQNTKTQSAVKEIANRIGKFKGSPEELGKLVQSGIENHEKEFHAAQNTMYDAIAQKVGEHTVHDPIYGQVSSGILDSTTKKPIMRTAIIGYQDKQVDNVMPSRTKIVAFAKKALNDLEAGQAAGGRAEPSAYEKTLRSIIDNKSPDATYRGMQKARSAWLSLARDHNSGLTDEEGGLIKKMAGLADDSINDAMQKSKLPGILDEWRAANKFTADEKAMFEQDLVKKIAETKKPEAIATILRGRATDATVGTGIQETRDIMDVIPKEMHAPLQRQMLLDTMRQSTNRQSKLFNERKFAERIGNIGDERGEIIFGKNWKNIKELTELLEKINGPVGLGGGTGAALQNIGAIRGIVEASYLTPLALVAGGHLPSGAATAVGSFGFMQGLARALTNPQATTNIIKALQYTARSVPYIATGVVAETGGTKKNLERVKEEAQKLKAKAAAPQVVPPGVTHVYDPATDSINAVPQ